MNPIESALATVVLALACGNAGSAGATSSSASAVHAVGSGPVTVVFESGLGDTAEVWGPVQASVADRCARTLSYTRNGYGTSTPMDGRRDAAHIVDELRSRLLDSGASPPYVLVGHSLGGLYMQYYARAYPAEVRGLVLVDSMHRDQLRRVKAVTPGLYRMMNVLTFVIGGAMRQEFVGIPRTADELETLPPANHIPTVVLSSTLPSPGDTPEFRALTTQLQDEIAAEFSALRHEKVAESGHYIQRDQPLAVIAAARALAGCGK